MTGTRPLILKIGKVFAYLILIISVVGVGCRKPAPVIMEGKYCYSFGGMTDTLKFNKDGTFSQTVVYANGHTVSLNDSWKVVNRGLKLQSFYSTFDIEKRSLIDPPIKGAFAILWIENGMLVKEPHTEYIFLKVKE